MKILAFGEVLWDVVENNYHLGGAPLNFAAHAIKCGVSSAIISAVGKDELGNKCIKEIEKIGVETSFIQNILHKNTGTVQVEIKNGQPYYEIINDVAFDHINSEFIDFESIKSFDCFYFGTLAQRNPVSQSCLKIILYDCDFKHVFFDANLRQSYYSKSMLDFSLKKCSILKLNDEEVEILSDLLFYKKMNFKDFINELINKYPSISVVIITKGADGCLVYKDKIFTDVASQPITVKDTIGAGDSFSAAFCSSYFKNNDVIEAATFANKIGGIVASMSGAIPQYSL
jgi:fructokinase